MSLTWYEALVQMDSLETGDTGTTGGELCGEVAVPQQQTQRRAIVPPLAVGAAQTAQLRADLQAVVLERDEARLALQVRPGLACISILPVGMSILPVGIFCVTV